MKRAAVMSMAVIGLLVVASGLQADTIELKDGKKILRIQIEKEGLLKVEYKKQGLPSQYVDSERVKSIKYRTTGNEYKSAVKALEEKAYFDAAEFFEAAAEKSSHKIIFQAHCVYRAGESYQKAGNWAKAISIFTAFVNEFNTHRLYPRALVNRGKCLLNTRDTKKAKKTFAILQKKVAEKGLPDNWKYESLYWMTYMQERENSSKALSSYQSIYDETKDSYPSIANMARLRIGRVYMSEKKFSQATALFDEIIENRFKSDDEIVAWAFLSRGNCVMNKNTKGDKGEFKKALFDLLRVVIHYEEVGSPQAEAMFWAGKCFQHLGEKDAAKRWQSLYRRIKREWPGTQWAQHATNELGG